MASKDDCLICKREIKSGEEEFVLLRRRAKSLDRAQVGRAHGVCMRAKVPDLGFSPDMLVRAER